MRNRFWLGVNYRYIQVLHLCSASFRRKFDYYMFISCLANYVVLYFNNIVFCDIMLKLNYRLSSITT